MNISDSKLHSRILRPAAVLVVDLVHFTQQAKEVKDAVLKIMEGVFHKTLNSLKLQDVHFNFTGDGYFCAFMGDSSTWVLDFINYTMPELKSRLADYSLQLRAGLDYGLVRLMQNNLTGSIEIMGHPGILATRLEQAAEANQILCSKTIHAIFIHSHPEMFPEDEKLIKIKDGEVLSYEVLPLDFEELQNTFLNLVFQTKPMLVEDEIKSKKILIVDDEDWLLGMLKEALSKGFPYLEIITAKDSSQALELYQPNEFALVITDINMGKISGFELTELILKRNPAQQIIIMTGLADSACAKHSFDIGAFDFIPKPFTIEQLFALVGNAMANLGSFNARKTLAVLSEEPGAMFMLIQQIASRLNNILSRTKISNDNANTMLRHKAKQVVRDFAGRIRPGQEILKELSIVKTQLEFVERLSLVVGKVQIGELEKFIKSLYSDLGEVHPKIKFMLTWKNFKSSKDRMPFEPVVVLIISELIDNAISALSGTGIVETKISVLESTNVLRILVHDSGVGIPDELREKVFTEGVSTKGEGRGLGLWLIREAAHSLKGSISYEYDNGAKFLVHIPLD